MQSNKNRPNYAGSYSQQVNRYADLLSVLGARLHSTLNRHSANENEQPSTHQPASDQATPACRKCRKWLQRALRKLGNSR
jgi:hypothetical protein